MAARVELEVSGKAGTPPWCWIEPTPLLSGGIRIVTSASWEMAGSRGFISCSRQIRQTSLCATWAAAMERTSTAREFGAADTTNAMPIGDVAASAEVNLVDGDRIDVGKASIIVRLVNTCDECGARIVCQTRDYQTGSEPATTLCNGCRYRTQVPDCHRPRIALSSPAKLAEQMTDLHCPGDLAAYAPGEMLRARWNGSRLS